MYEACKLCRLPDGSWLGLAGGVADCKQAEEWFERGQDLDKRPDIEYLDGMLVTPEGHMYAVGARCCTTRIYDTQYASGSGDKFALSAMALGMGAVKAVAFAARFDPHTGIGVDAVAPGEEECTQVLDLVREVREHVEQG